MSWGNRVRIEARHLSIPFVTRFSHAAARRDSSQTLWTEIHDEHGNCGYGEGCPREYVTGESVAGGLRFIAACTPRWQSAITDMASLHAWVAENRALIDSNPAAWCAVELAFLDLFGKQSGRSVESLLDLPPLSGEFRYSAVLGDADPQRFERTLARYQQLGLEHYKIKLSGNPGADLSKVAALKLAGIDPARTRADANNAWRHPIEAGAFLKSLCYPFTAIEEPLRPGDIEGQRHIAKATGARIILDESLLGVDQLAAYAGVDFPWLANIRVSRLGGLIRSLEVARRAAPLGAGIVVGAHVGETSLLTRAALTVAHALRHSLYAQEGAFGHLLLAYDMVAAPIQFGAGGIVAARDLPERSGFGLCVAGPPQRI